MYSVVILQTPIQKQYTLYPAMHSTITQTYLTMIEVQCSNLGRRVRVCKWVHLSRYICGLKQLIDDKDKLLNENTYARVKIDIPSVTKKQHLLKKHFSKQFGVRELSPIPKEQEEEYIQEDVHSETVNQIVLQQLETVESNTIDKQMLIDIYNDIEIQYAEYKIINAIKNFMSVGNNTQGVRSDDETLTLVLGNNLDLGGDGSRNGTGKTTINRPSYALYGEALTNIRRDNPIQQN